MIAKWFFVAWFALSALLTVAMVGKPRKPMTPGTAAIAVLIDGVFIVLVVMFWGGAS